jgi:hypothetical protein
MLDLGLREADVDEFLSCLRVVRQYHARPSIDAVTIRLLMGLVPGHSAHIEALYDKLLQRVIAAHLGAAASADPAHPLALQHVPTSDEQEQVEEHRLSRSELLTLLPPVPALEGGRLLARRGRSPTRSPRGGTVRPGGRWRRCRTGR